MRVFLFLWLTVAASAQTLEVSPSTAGRGDSGAFQIRLKIPATTKLVALQWQIRVPIEVVIDQLYIAPGSAVVSADKTLSCMRWRKSDRNHAVYRCVIYGGRKAIGGGTVAVVQYQVSTKAKSALAVDIENVIAASPEADAIPIASTQGTIELK